MGYPYIGKKIHPKVILLAKEFDDVDEWNDNGSREFDEYAEFDKADYRNFDPIEEYHDDYPEFPMEDQPETGRPKEEDDTERMIRHHHMHISAAQALATTVVAVVVVTGIFIPILENESVSIYIDGKIADGFISYYVSMDHYDETMPYYAVLLENGSIVHQQVISDGFAKYYAEYKDTGKEVVVEVRSGSPPLYVVERKTIAESTEIWVELDHLEGTSDTVDYGVIVHGSGAELTLQLLDAQYNTVFSKTIYEGSDSGVIEKLNPDSTYYLDVSDVNKTYLFEEITLPGN